MEQPNYGKSPAEIPGTLFDIPGFEGEHNSTERLDHDQTKNVVLVTVDGFGGGGTSDRLRERTGDLLLVPEGRRAIWYSDMHKTGVRDGTHENEMCVPFCTVRASEISI